MDDFNGDNAKLVECINALLSMDEAGALRPHGVGGHGRKLLEAAASRLQALSHAAGQEVVGALSRGVPEGNQAAVDSVIRQYCRTCGGCGEIGGHSGQTPESYEEWSAPCPDCSPAAIAAQRKEG